MTANPRTRWADLLNTSADAAPDAALAAFLRALPGDDFVPPAERAAAVNALAGASVPVGKDGDADELLRDEVRAFAAGFWALPPAERLTVWADLSRRVTGERAAAALLALEPGLDVAADPLPDPGAEELAALARELFVLPPRERAIRRNEWLAARASDGALWPHVIAAFATLRRTAPARAALDPQLGVALAPTFDRAALTAGYTTTTRPESEATAAAERARVAMKMRDYKERVAARYGEPDSHPRTFLHKKLWLFLVLAFVLFMGYLATLHRGYGPKPRPAESPVVKPSFQPPPRTDIPTPGGQSASEFFTPDRVAACLDYENAHKAGRNVTAPSYYMIWIRANRPGDPNPPRTVPAPKVPPPAFRQTFTFTKSDIEGFQRYARAPDGFTPAFFDVWVEFGKPTEPGTYKRPAPNP